MPERRRQAEQWAYLVHYLWLLRWSAGQAQLLRCAYRRPQRYKDVKFVPEVQDLPTASEKKPARRLRWIADAMPTVKADLVELCETWNVPLPDRAASMRVVDLQEALRQFDAGLSETTVDHQAVAIARASRKVTSGQKHKGKTYLEVFMNDPDYCD